MVDVKLTYLSDIKCVDFKQL